MTIPDMNEFFIRGIPIDVACEARKKWSELTEEAKDALGFNTSPLTKFLHNKLIKK